MCGENSSSGTGEDNLPRRECQSRAGGRVGFVVACVSRGTKRTSRIRQSVERGGGERMETVCGRAVTNGKVLSKTTL